MNEIEEKLMPKYGENLQILMQIDSIINKKKTI